MAFFWKDEFSTNVVSIDEQHKRLLDIGSKLYYAVSLNDGYDHYDEIMSVLSDLKEYTIYHFQYEEDLLEKHGYSNLENHKKEHQSFIDRIISIEKQDIDEKQEKISMEIIVFLADWISSHILKADHKYRDLLNSKDVR